MDVDSCDDRTTRHPAVGVLLRSFSRSASLSFDSHVLPTVQPLRPLAPKQQLLLWPAVTMTLMPLLRSL